MKKILAVAAALALVFAFSDVRAQRNVQRNSQTVGTIDTLRFVTSGVVRDTIITTNSTDSTRNVSLAGVTDAVLYVLVYVEEGDQSDTIEVNLAYTVRDTGNVPRWSAFTPIDSIFVTAADAASVVHAIDLTAAATTTNNVIPLKALEDVRFRFDGIGIAAADTLHVTPWLFKQWTRQPQQ